MKDYYILFEVVLFGIKLIANILGTLYSDLTGRQIGMVLLIGLLGETCNWYMISDYFYLFWPMTLSPIQHAKHRLCRRCGDRLRADVLTLHKGRRGLH